MKIHSKRVGKIHEHTLQTSVFFLVETAPPRKAALYVVNRHGKSEEVKFDRITDRLKWKYHFWFLEKLITLHVFMVFLYYYKIWLNSMFFKSK